MSDNNYYRLLVLIILAAAIFVSGWQAAKPATQTSSYFWADGALIRAGGRKAGQGVPLTAGISCADMPPDAAHFFGLPLPVDRADQYALMALPGIGQKLAENIIKYRAEKGSIAGPDDLIKVKGIGPKRLALLMPLLCFDQEQ